MVARGEIYFTVCDHYIAQVNQIYYRFIVIETPVSFSQNYAWAMNIGAESLKTNLNEWLEEFLASLQGRIVYNKYYVNQRSFQ